MIRSLIRDLAADVLNLSTLTRPSRCAAGRLGVATFHRVLPDALRKQYPLPGLCVTPEEFDWFLSYFDQHFDCGTLTSRVNRWQSGAESSSGKPQLAITFDDGQLDNFEYALPVLERHGLKASFYIPLESVDQRTALWHDRVGFALLHILKQGAAGRRKLTELLDIAVPSDGTAAETAYDLIGAAKGLAPETRAEWLRVLEERAGGSQVPAWAQLMNWDQLRKLAENGHEIGSHTMSHSLLPQCTDDQLEYEVAESRRRLQGKLGLPVESFCYPNGDFDERVAAMVRKAGYETAVTTQWGFNPEGQGLERLKRWDMNAEHVKRRNGELSAARLALRMSGLQPGLSR